MSKETKTKDAGFGIEHMAKYLGVTPVVARDKLRRAGLQPSGGKWHWSTMTKLEADGKKVKGPNAKKAVKPAGKAPAKAAAKPAAKKEKAAA